MSTKLHGVIQKGVILVLTAVRTGDFECGSLVLANQQLRYGDKSQRFIIKD
jgi:hypothetical protein